MSDFETWWEREGQEFLYALNTTTDDDIKLVAEVAWKNGAYCAEQAEQPVSQEYQDHLVNQSFDWAAMAAKHQFMEGYRVGLAEMREKCANVCDDIDKHFDYTIAARQCAAAIRGMK